MTSPITIAIVLLLPIVFIGIGYYFDYKHNKQAFLKALKSIVICIIIIAAGSYILRFTSDQIANFIPWDNNYGKSYNSARKKFGIPLIEDSWKPSENTGHELEQWWMDTLDTNNSFHTTKIIKFNLLGPTAELDYYSAEKAGFRLEVKYNYKDNTVSYSKISRPGLSSFNHIGYTQPSSEDTVVAITKEEFKIILRNWQ